MSVARRRNRKSLKLEDLTSGKNRKSASTIAFRPKRSSRTNSSGPYSSSGSHTSLQNVVQSFRNAVPSLSLSASRNTPPPPIVEEDQSVKTRVVDILDGIRKEISSNPDSSKAMDAITSLATDAVGAPDTTSSSLAGMYPMMSPRLRLATVKTLCVFSPPFCVSSIVRALQGSSSALTPRRFAVSSSTLFDLLSSVLLRHPKTQEMQEALLPYREVFQSFMLHAAPAERANIAALFGSMTPRAPLTARTMEEEEVPRIRTRSSSASSISDAAAQALAWTHMNQKDIEASLQSPIVHRRHDALASILVRGCLATACTDAVADVLIVDTDASIRRLAARALSAIGVTSTSASHALLHAAGSDKDGMVREAARQSLEELGIGALPPSAQRAASADAKKRGKMSVRGKGSLRLKNAERLVLEAISDMEISHAEPEKRKKKDRKNRKNFPTKNQPDGVTLDALETWLTEHGEDDHGKLPSALEKLVREGILKAKVYYSFA